MFDSIINYVTSNKKVIKTVGLAMLGITASFLTDWSKEQQLDAKIAEKVKEALAE